jgi:DNA-binding MarR family transcriptional regulator
MNSATTKETHGGETNRARGESRAKKERYTDAKGKTRRAYRAYVDLIETADWLRELAARHVAAFRMTLAEYRVMERILRRGPLYPAMLGQRMGCTRQNVTRVIEKLERHGWVKRVEGKLPRRHRVEIGWIMTERVDRRAAAEEAAKAAVGRAASGKDRTGRRVVRVFLTEKGREAIEDAVRKHEKYVKAEMRALEGREQETLSRLCRKLQEGDAVRFFREVQRMDWKEDEARKSIAKDIAFVTQQLAKVIRARPAQMGSRV